jgi:glycine dehydrogenase subunit 1
LGQSALYCVTEVHTKVDLDRLVDVLEEVVVQ